MLRPLVRAPGRGFSGGVRGRRCRRLRCGRLSRCGRAWPRRCASVQSIGHVHRFIHFAQRSSPAASRGVGRCRCFGSAHFLDLLHQTRQVEVPGTANHCQHHSDDRELQYGIPGTGWARRELPARAGSRWRRARGLSRSRGQLRGAGRQGLGSQRWWSGPSRRERRLYARYKESILTGRTLDLMPGPRLVTRDMLPAVGAGELKLCHKYSFCPALLPKSPGQLSRRGRALPIYSTDARGGQVCMPANPPAQSPHS